MSTQERSSKRDIVYGLCDVVAVINEDPNFEDDGSFWGVIERLSRAIALIEALPAALVEDTLASIQCLTDFNDYMTDWADGISPMGGWSKDLLARLPAENVTASFPYLDVC